MQQEDSITIDAPPGRVWAVMSEVERWPEWTASIRSVQLLTPGPLALASRARIEQPRLPAAIWEVTALEPGRTFTWVSRYQGGFTAGTHTVTPTASGAGASLHLAFNGPVGWLIGTLLGGMSRRYLRLEIEGLKRRSEEA